MNCPACDHLLQPLKAGPVMVDACIGGCGGIWFDAFEMQKVDEEHEPGAEQLLDIPGDSNVQVDYDRKRKCPRCETVVMLRHAHKDNPAVTVDECPGCGGFWLDAGELGLIRRSHVLTEKKRAHTQALLEQLKRQSLAALHHQPEEAKRRSHAITTINAFFHAWPE
ncbi:hypothetical protein GC207_09275 [bacterium]|nr:hypothetical protein [bacterium]